MIKFLFLLSFMCINTYSFTQSASISGRIKNAKGRIISFTRSSQTLSTYEFKMAYAEIQVDKEGSFKTAFEIEEPEIIKATLYDSLDKLELQYNFFLTPGDKLQVLAVAGDNNNQPLALFTDYDSIDVFYKDTLPDRIYNYVLKTNNEHRRLLKTYINQYQPSKEFIEAWDYHLAYKPAETYYDFEHSNAFDIREAYKRNKDKWLERRQELFKAIRLSNDSALAAPAYRSLVRYYLLRTKETLWRLAYENRSAFLQEWYADDTTKGWSAFQKDAENQLLQRIIEKTSTGKTKEYAYALLLEGSINRSSIVNLVAIYNDFTKQYPASKYRKFFDGPVATINKQQQKPLTDKMVFIRKGETFTTWEEVLEQVKGKTVLLDMWGTWCGPCRSEIKENGPAIKEHFKKKGLDYLYIANYDEKKKETWEKLIAFFDMEGYHILANEKLTKDIMAKIKGKGYPTYAIIDKYGNVELSGAGYPMDREKLIKQLEETLEKE